MQQGYDLPHGLDRVQAVRLRMRSAGHVLYGGTFILPHNATDVLPKLRQATADAQALDWHIGALVLAAVEELPE